MQTILSEPPMKCMQDWANAHNCIWPGHPGWAVYLAQKATEEDSHHYEDDDYEDED